MPSQRFLNAFRAKLVVEKIKILINAEILQKIGRQLSKNHVSQAQEVFQKKNKF